MGRLYLWVNGFDASKDEWTKVGTSPYLDAQDQPTNYVYATAKKAEIGDFSFVDTSSAGTLISVELFVYGQSGIAGANDTFYLWDGIAWNAMSGLNLPATWSWVSIDASSILNTWTKVNGATMYIKHPNSTTQSDVDAAYLLVTFSLDQQESSNISDQITATQTAGGIVETQDVSEFLNIFDTITMLKTSIFNVQDYIENFDSVTTEITTGGVTQTQEIYDFLNAIDAVNLRILILREFIESKILGDIAPQMFSSFAKSITDYDVIYDAPTTVSTVIKSQDVSDYVNTFENTTQFFLPVKTSSEYLSIFDLLTTFSSQTRIIQDYKIIYDATSQTLTTLNLQTINDYMTSFDVLTNLSNFTQSFYDDAQIYDAVSTVITGLNLWEISDYVNTFEATSYLTVYTRYLSHADSASLISALTKIQQITDYWTTFDLTTKQSVMMLQLTESSVKSDAATQLISRTLTTEDFGQLQDVVSTSFSVPNLQTINEYTQLYESLTFQSSFITSITDNTILYDTVSTIFSQIRTETITDYLQPFDETNYFITFLSQIKDYLETFDSIEQVFNPTKVFNEYIKTWETVTTTIGEISELILQLIRCIEVP